MATPIKDLDLEKEITKARAAYRKQFEKLQEEANNNPELEDLYKRILWWSERKKEFLQNLTVRQMQTSGDTMDYTNTTGENALDQFISAEIEHLKRCIEVEGQYPHAEGMGGFPSYRVGFAIELGIKEYLREKLGKGGISETKLTDILGELAGSTGDGARMIANRISKNEESPAYSNWLDAVKKKLGLT